MQLSEIHLYPIKSLGGISVQAAKLSNRGLAHDRRFMLVDPTGMFLTQRKFAQMALLQPEIRGEQLVISHKKKDIPPLHIDLRPTQGTPMQVEVWGSQVAAWQVDSMADAWFSEQLGMPVHLVYMPEQSHRKLKEKYRAEGALVSFADGTPYLIIGQGSLDYLNAQLETPVPMDRFRPNFVFTGGQPHVEDEWHQVQIGEALFKCLGTCIRCQVPNIDQATAMIQKEPNRTLARYRAFDHQIHYGMNLALIGEGTVAVGMEVSPSS